MRTAGRRHEAPGRVRRAGTLYASGILFLVLWFLFSAPSLVHSVSAAEKWQGVDEAVIEKFAGEHGRTPKEGFIGKEASGDLLPFAFLIAGAAGGFAAGYFWRVLTERKARGEEQRRPQ